MAIEAERVVVTLEAQTAQAAAAIQNYERTTTNALRKVSTEAVSSEKAVGAATRNLGFQVIDTGTQLAGGTSPFLVLAQQGPQAMQAIEMVSAAGGTLGTVLKGLALPAIIAVASAVLGMAASHSKAVGAQNDHKKATDELKAAVDRLNDSSAQNDHTTRQGIIDDINRAKAARERANATLDVAQAELAAAQARYQFLESRPELGDSAGLAMILDARKINEAAAKILALRAEIRRSATASLNAGAQLALRDVAAQTDKTTAANQRYEDSIDRLRRRFEAGKIDRGTFERLALAATRQRDAALEAAKATNRHSNATTGLADAQASLLSADNDVQRAEASLRIEREKARAELKAGKITQDEYTARVAAAIDAVQAAKLAQNEFKESLQGTIVTGFDLIDMLKRLQDEGDRRFASLFAPEMDQLKKLTSFDAEHEQNKQLFAEQERMRQEQQRKSEENIRDLASLYEDLFRGGADAIWGDFKAIGLRVIAELLAKWTIARLGGDVSGFQGSGGIVGGLVSGLGSIFGLASGGYAAPGSLHRVNEHAGGVELLRMGPEGGQVIPLGQARAAQPAGNTTVIQNITVDARNSVNPAGFERRILDQANGFSVQVGQAAKSSALAEAPAAVRRRRRYQGG